MTSDPSRKSGDLEFQGDEMATCVHTVYNKESILVNFSCTEKSNDMLGSALISYA